MFYTNSCHVLLWFLSRPASIYLHRLLTPSHILVLFLLCSYSVVVQSITGQQLDNNWTTTKRQLNSNRRWIFVAYRLPGRWIWDEYEMHNKLNMRWTWDKYLLFCLQRYKHSSKPPRENSPEIHKRRLFFLFFFHYSKIFHIFAPT